MPVTIAVLAVLLIAGGWWWLSTGGRPAAIPTTSPAAPTSPATTAPGTTATTGGQLGQPVTLGAATGSASVTVSSATWGAGGEMTPAAGTSYLVVDLEATGTSGTVTVSSLYTVAVTADGQRYSPAFGPQVDHLLASTELSPGDIATGQLGFMLPPGPVTLTFTDPDGQSIGTVEVPGP